MKKSKLIQLVKKMQNGEESAFEELIHEFQVPLYHIALELTQNEADAKDVVQNTFIQLHASIQNLNEPNVLVLWMKRILVNKCHNLYRARKNTIYNDDVVESRMNAIELSKDETYESFKNSVSQRILHHLVNQLNYIQKEVIVLHYFDQLKIKEIAKLLNISEGTVKSRMNSAKVALRVLCQEYEENNHEKVSMHIGVGSALTLMYASMYAPSLLKKSIFRLRSMRTVNTVNLLALGTCVVLATGGTAYLASQQKANIEPRNDVIDTNNSVANKEVDRNDQNAYFKLRTWAHCIDEMKQRDLASMEAIYPYFQQLKEHKGAYWSALQADKWADDFENIYKNK